MGKKKEPNPENQEAVLMPVSASSEVDEASLEVGVVSNAAVGNDPLSYDDAETRSKRAFFGRSAQLAVMAEFLHRHINVAIPEVDVGDDIFVVKGLSSQVTRVQVKGATAKEQQDSYVVLVNVPSDQLKVPQDSPPLVYAFPIRRGKATEGRWTDILVIRRSTLFARYTEQAGKEYSDDKGKSYVQFRVVLTADSAMSGTGKVDFQKYRNAWNPWPPPLLAEET